MGSSRLGVGRNTGHVMLNAIVLVYGLSQCATGGGMRRAIVCGPRRFVYERHAVLHAWGLVAEACTGACELSQYIEVGKAHA